MQHNPPKLAQRLLLRFLRPDLAEEVQGDLEEQFYAKLEESSVFRAKLNYWYQVLNYLRPFATRKSKSTYLNYYPMFHSYFKIGWRNLLKNKGYSFINIGGLAAGMAVAMLISLWIYDELSYNKYHENYDRIGQIMRNEIWDGEVATGEAMVTGLATLLRTDYSDHFQYVVMATKSADHILTHGEEKFSDPGRFMHPEAPHMLSLKMIYGTRDGLSDMYSILIAESVAKKLFGDTNPMNQQITMDGSTEVKIAGVYEDLPYNSGFNELKFIAPMDLFMSLNKWTNYNSWDNYFMRIYAQLPPSADTKTGFEEVSAIIKDAMKEHTEEQPQHEKTGVFLFPMSRWHLYSKFENGISVGSERLSFVWLNGIIGVFVLLLACINFMNLSTARSEKRAKEVGIRKAIGSARRQLVQQFFSESLLVAALSFIFSILLVLLILPAFNQLSGKDLTLPVTNLYFWAICLAVTFITGMLAGSYPALYLSSFNVVKILKGTFRVGRFAAVPRKVLVVFQFTISIALIIGTIIVYQQIQFTKNRPIGYEREGLLTLPVNSSAYFGKYEALRTSLKNTGVVAEIAEANYPLTNTLGNNNGFDWPGRDPDYDPSFNTVVVTPEYGETVGWEVMAGRGFSREYSSDFSGKVVINESALEVMDLENPVGETIRFKRDYFGGNEFTILGVVKDMIKGSPYEPAVPSIVFLSNNDLSWLFIKIKPEVSASVAVTKIEAAFKEVIPSVPFDYKFADDEFDTKFRAEERIGKLAAFFTAFAIFISCLGLFALASYVAEQRTKEIGIRKILGASVVALWRMLSKDFVILVALSCLIAIPFAYYFMHTWLQQYEYRTEITWWIFASAGIGALVITLLTVSYQTVKAALMNPVKSLRSE